MQKIDWKIFAPILLLFVIAYAVWLQHWKDTGQMLNGLGRGKKQRPQSPPQIELFDSDGKPTDPETTKLPTKIQLLTRSINDREKMLMYLKEVKKAKKPEIKDNFMRMAKEAQNKALERENYLKNNFERLNGAQKIYL